MPEFSSVQEAAFDYAFNKIGERLIDNERLEEIVEVAVAYLHGGICVLQSTLNPMNAFYDSDLFVRRAGFWIGEYLWEEVTADTDARVKARIKDFRGVAVRSLFDSDTVRWFAGI
jgi:hypothetical protein